METQTRKLDKDRWGPYFDHFSQRLGATTISVLVEGLDLGVQQETVKVPLLGITYDHEDDAIEISAENLTHRIGSPTAVYVQESASGALLSCEITDSDGHKQILELDPALVLVASA